MFVLFFFCREEKQTSAKDEFPHHTFLFSDAEVGEFDFVPSSSLPGEVSVCVREGWQSSVGVTLLQQRPLVCLCVIFLCACVASGGRLVQRLLPTCDVTADLLIDPPFDRPHRWC